MMFGHSARPIVMKKWWGMHGALRAMVCEKKGLSKQNVGVKKCHLDIYGPTERVHPNNP